MVRVYREGLSDRRKLVGIVEEVGIKGNRAFTNFDELWDILNQGHQKDTNRNNKSWKPSTESRNNIRKDMAFFTGYAVDSSAGQITCSGVITNISKSGICLLTPKALNKGEHILIKCKTNSPERKALVRWSKQYKDSHCRVGLEIVN
jgi:hypothetical protein